MSKLCGKCEIEKDIKEFYVDNSKSDGRQGSCKYCQKKHSKDYCDKNLKRKLKVWLEYKKRNLEKIKEHNRIYSQRRRDRLKALKRT